MLNQVRRAGRADEVSGRGSLGGSPLQAFEYASAAARVHPAPSRGGPSAPSLGRAPARRRAARVGAAGQRNRRQHPRVDPQRRTIGDSRRRPGAGKVANQLTTRSAVPQPPPPRSLDAPCSRWRCRGREPQRSVRANHPPTRTSGRGVPETPDTRSVSRPWTAWISADGRGERGKSRAGRRGCRHVDDAVEPPSSGRARYTAGLGQPSRDARIESVVAIKRTRTPLDTTVSAVALRPQLPIASSG